MEDEQGFFDVINKSIVKNNEADFINSLNLMVQEKMSKDSDFNDDITVLAIKA